MIENQARFTSTFTLNKELHYDFLSVSYHRLKKTALIFFIMSAWLVTANIIVGNYELAAGSGSIMSFCLLFIYLKTCKSIDIAYERSQLGTGCASTLAYELYEDKILSLIDGSNREFRYEEFTKFYETKYFILLHLKHNVYVALDKSSLNANIDDLNSFLLDKCTSVKNPKFINCTKDKTASLLLLISTIVVSVVGIVVVIIVNWNNLVFF